MYLDERDVGKKKNNLVHFIKMKEGVSFLEI